MKDPFILKGVLIGMLLELMVIGIYKLATSAPPSEPQVQVLDPFYDHSKITPADTIPYYMEADTATMSTTWTEEEDPEYHAQKIQPEKCIIVVDTSKIFLINGSSKLRMDALLIPATTNTVNY